MNTMNASLMMDKVAAVLINAALLAALPLSAVLFVTHSL